MNINDESIYRIFKAIQAFPGLSQRQLANNLGVSLGKLNYCLKALIEKGFIKVRNFSDSKNKKGYFYLLTPKGISEKTRVTLRFLKRKIMEYEQIKHEIEELKSEIKNFESELVEQNE